MSNLSRRTFLTVAVFGFGGLLYEARSGIVTGRGDEHLLDLASTLDSDAVRSVGEAYLAVHPEGADRATLLRSLGRRLNADRQLTIQERYGRAVKDDFQNGRIVSVKGWMLSETEALLYALVHTTH